MNAKIVNAAYKNANALKMLVLTNANAKLGDNAYALIVNVLIVAVLRNNVLTSANARREDNAYVIIVIKNAVSKNVNVLKMLVLTNANAKLGDNAYALTVNVLIVVVLRNNVLISANARKEVNAYVIIVTRNAVYKNANAQ